MQSALLTLTQQNPSFEILFCGHSLGASMASIAAVDYKLNLNPSADPSKIILSTIGEPRTGNTGFSALLASLNFNAVQRAVNQRDSIPHFPATIAGFHHRSTEIWTNPNDGNTYLCDDADQGESSNCANTIDVFSLDGNDHLNYFGFKIGSDACLTS